MRLVGLSIGKTEIRKVAEVLDQEHETVEDAAHAVLKAALALFEAKAKFVVVGQLYYRGGYVSAEEARANRVGLGWYGTEHQAYEAGKMLGVPAGANESFKVYVVPTHMGTPADFHKARKKEREALLQEDRHSVLAEEMERRKQWFIEHPNEVPPAEWKWLGDPFEKKED